MTHGFIDLESQLSTLLHQKVHQKQDKDAARNKHEEFRGDLLGSRRIHIIKTGEDPIDLFHHFIHGDFALWGLIVFPTWRWELLDKGGLGARSC